MRRSTHFPQFVGPAEAAPAFEPLGDGTYVGCTGNSVRFRAGRATVEVTALADDVFRVGIAGDGMPLEYRSEAVPDTDWPPVSVSMSGDGTRIETERAVAKISVAPLRLGFADVGPASVDADGQDRPAASEPREFAIDDPLLGAGFAPLRAATDIGERLVDPLGAPACVFKRHLPGTRYFGCGERTGGLDKTHSRQVFWNIDPPVGHTAALNNLYTSVPFVLALHEGRAWGMFVDTGYRLEFDLASANADRCGFAVDGGPLIYYVFAGPTPRAVLERYTQLTGRIPMPPRWALGNHQSRWGYKSADEILELARTFRQRQIPLDVLYLDIDYMDGYRVFTWEPTRFPDPACLTRELAELGVKLVTIVDPGVKVDETYAVYNSGREADLFCTTFQGDEYQNVVWPGVCAFPDFTDPHVRTWWGDQLPALLNPGVAGIWCDMNEPTVFVPTPTTLPEDVTHHGEGRAVLHAQVHNLYGQFMARATYEGLRRQRPERRPVVISRSGFAGLQRYALHWTGDNSSWWEHLWMSMPQLQNLGLSGYAWVGVDVGGFSGDATPELLTRWTEFGIFQPFCRNHSAWDTHRQEPWAFGEPYESHMREMLLLRQRLIPYLYTLFDEAHRTGAPILRPLLFEFPDDATTYTADDEFMLGAALLVAPIGRPGTEYRHVYLPRGTWVQYWTGEHVDGPAHVLAHAPLGRPAIYVRANTPLPMWPPLEYESQHLPDPLTWLICLAPAPAEAGSGEWYDDAGDGYGFEQGEFARMRARCSPVVDGYSIELDAREGDWQPLHRHVEVELRGLAQAPRTVTVDGTALPQAGPPPTTDGSSPWTSLRTSNGDAAETGSTPTSATPMASADVESWSFADGRLVVRVAATSARLQLSILT